MLSNHTHLVVGCLPSKHLILWSAYIKWIHVLVSQLTTTDFTDMCKKLKYYMMIFLFFSFLMDIQVRKNSENLYSEFMSQRKM